MVTKLGNGKTTSLWFDNWSSVGALNSFVSHRDMYDARIAIDLKVYDMVFSNNWNWPLE